MINVHELRIGNYLNLNTSTMCGKSYLPINIGSLQSNFYGVAINNIGDLSQFDEPNYYQIGLFDFKLDNEKLLFWEREMESKMFGTADIIYLHQLQNFHFALSGKELEINL